VKVVVEIVSGARAGQRLEFDDPQVVRFGRHPTCEVAFDAVADRDASSRHAELRREGAGYIVADLGSANGTRLGGVAVNGRASVPPGAELEFGAGGPRCRVIYDGGAAMTVPPTMMKAGSSTGGKVGQRTVAMMIDQALHRVRRGSKRLQWIVIALAVALAGVVATAIVAWRLRPPADVALRREMGKGMSCRRVWRARRGRAAAATSRARTTTRSSW
jgi:hypothetical protein